MSPHQEHHPLQFPRHSFRCRVLLCHSQTPVSKHPHWSVLKLPLGGVHQRSDWRWSPDRRQLFRASKTPCWVLPSNKDGYERIGGLSQKRSAIKIKIEICKSICTTANCKTVKLQWKIFDLIYFYKNRIIYFLLSVIHVNYSCRFIIV